MTGTSRSSIYDGSPVGAARQAVQASAPSDAALRQPAPRGLPGGMWGHQSTRFLSPEYPQFLASASGAHIVDTDGRQYVDLMCAYGPILLGYQHPAVEAAAEKQRRLGGTQK